MGEIVVVQGNINHRVEVGQRDDGQLGALERLGSHRELVIIDNHDTQDNAAGVTHGIQALHAVVACRELVLDEHDLLSRLDVALNQVLQTVILGRRTHVHEGHGQRVGYQRAVGDGSRGNAGDDLGFAEVLHDQSRHLHLDEVAHLGVGEGHSQVSVYGGLPTCGPGEGAVRLQLDGIDAHQFLGK